MHFRTPPTFFRSPISIVTTAARPSPRFLSPRAILPLGLSLGLSYTLLPTKSHIRFDDAPFSSTSKSSFGGRNNSPSSSGGSGSSGGGPFNLDPSTVRQITTGSIIGLVAGLAVSMFSRTLTVLIGLGVVTVQYLSSKGIKIIPAEKIQRYVKSVDVKKLVQSNPALKISFGVTFMLAAFGSF